MCSQPFPVQERGRKNDVCLRLTVCYRVLDEAASCLIGCLCVAVLFIYFNVFF